VGRASRGSWSRRGGGLGLVTEGLEVEAVGLDLAEGLDLFGGSVADFLGHGLFLGLCLTQSHEGGGVADILVGLGFFLNQHLQDPEVGGHVGLGGGQGQVVDAGDLLLAVAVDAAVALLQGDQGPGHVEVDQVVAVVVEVDALAGCIPCDQGPDGALLQAEGLDDFLLAYIRQTGVEDLAGTFGQVVGLLEEGLEQGGAKEGVLAAAIQGVEAEILEDLQAGFLGAAGGNLAELHLSLSEMLSGVGDDIFLEATQEEASDVLGLVVLGVGDGGGVEHVHQVGEGGGLAVMGGGRGQDQAVAGLGQEAGEAIALGVLVGDVVAFVEDDGVPVAGLQEGAVAPVILEGVDGDDHLFEHLEGILAGGNPAAEALDSGGIEADQGDGEAGPELLLELEQHALHHHDQDAAAPASLDQLGEQDASLQGLAQADPVGDQDAGAESFQGSGGGLGSATISVFSGARSLTSSRSERNKASWSRTISESPVTSTTKPSSWRGPRVPKAWETRGSTLRTSHSSSRTWTRAPGAGATWRRRRFIGSFL
jgi:hypothetical protein